MVVNDISNYDVEFIKHLKKIENDARWIDQKFVRYSSHFMYTRMNDLFDKFIQVDSLTTKHVNYLFDLIKKSKINYRIEAIILANLVIRIDNLGNNRLRQSVIEKHMFGIDW